LTDLIGISKYTAQQLYTKDRDEFKNMKCVNAISNIIYIGKKSMTDNQVAQNLGPLVKA